MENTFTLRLAISTDIPAIWQIMQQAIAKRHAEGSTQWQDGYPNVGVIVQDVAKAEGYVITQTNGLVVAYVVFSQAPEPAYEALQTGWVTQNIPYVVVHRLAVSQQPKIKGLAFWILQQAEVLAKSWGIGSIKVDTNFDNAPMLHLFNKLGYVYVGEVFFRGSARQAFEKLL